MPYLLGPVTFLTHRIHEHNEWLFYASQFGSDFLLSKDNQVMFHDLVQIDLSLLELLQFWFKTCTSSVGLKI